MPSKEQSFITIVVQMSSFEGEKREREREGHLQKRKINKQTNTFDTFVFHCKRKRKWTLENRRKNNNSKWKQNNERISTFKTCIS